MSNVLGGNLPTTVKNVAPGQVLSHSMRIAGHQMIAPRPGAPSGQIQVRLPPGTNLPPNVVLINNKDGSLQAVQVGGTIAQSGAVPGTVTYRHVQPGGSQQQLIAPRAPTPTIIHQPHHQQQFITHSAAGKPGTPVVVSVTKPGQPNMTMVYTSSGGQRTVGPVTIGVPSSQSPMQMSQPVVTHVPQQPSTSSGTPATVQIPMSQSAIENVKKCKNFLTTLIKLASNANQAPETVQNVKDLVQNLIDGRIEPEGFTQKLQKELHSSPQPYLVPFLKKSLPLLRQTLQRSGATTLQGINPQSLQSAGTAATPTSVKPSKAATVTVGSSSKHIIAGSSAGGSGGKTATINISAQQLEQIAARGGKAGLAQLQQLAQKAKAQGQPPGQLVTTTIGGQTKTIFLPHSAILGAQAQVQAAQAAAAAASTGKSGATPKTSSGSSKPRSGGTPSRSKDKGKDHAAAAASFKDDDDINDVASMAGVNLSEESARIMATNADFIGTQMRSIKEEKFLIQDPLHDHINRLCQKHGLQNASSEVMDLISLATQERLKLLTEKLCTIAAHRMEAYRNDSRFEVTTDIKTQLKVFEQLDSLERKRREEQEREILMRAAKSRSKQEDPEQLKLKQRAKEMQQMELEQMRQKEANLTALAAIGSRKKRKVDSPTPGSVPGGPGQATGSSFLTNLSTPSSTSRRRPMPRIKRVNLRDVLFLLEQEREMKKSQLLFKSFLK
ncbi:transcription initiation factor TFIID subunit 4-like [Amphiura filiformis]|uniref:transcription initiation factor TFIID subunit 4-like n=1 Tax=Amphiura filiformis TaxID=82378 RepID=UPI003B210416